MDRPGFAADRAAEPPPSEGIIPDGAAAPAPRERPRDLGFGTVLADQSRRRLLNRDGTFNVERRGLGYFSSLGLYHALLSVSWPRFFAAVAGTYVGANAIFAMLYLLDGPGALAGPVPAAGPLAARAMQAFFFSVQTFATIGYGQVAPVGTVANLIVTGESLVGLLTLALAAGLLFARIARPTARILFSDTGIVAPYRGITGFMFRTANARRSQLFEVEVQLTMSRLEDVGGRRMRNFYALPLERDRVMFFTHYWTVVHPIDLESPLHGVTPDELLRSDAEFVILLSGIDETFAQTVHARSSYKAHEVVWGAKFADIFDRSVDDGVMRVDLDRLSDIERVGLSPPIPAAQPALPS